MVGVFFFFNSLTKMTYCIIIFCLEEKMPGRNDKNSPSAFSEAEAMVKHDGTAVCYKKFSLSWSIRARG